MADELFTFNELWILRAGIESLRDYQLTNRFPQEVREVTKSLLLKIMRMINDDPIMGKRTND